MQHGSKIVGVKEFYPRVHLQLMLEERQAGATPFLPVGLTLRLAITTSIGLV